MKTTGSFALLGLMLLSCLADIAVAQRRASCGMFLTSGKTQQLQVACPRDYSPVCGTDGKTYPNECTLCREIFTRNRGIDKKHDGRCVKVDCTGFLKASNGQVFPCTMDYSPICGTNGITYKNKCNFCSAVANGLDVNLRSYGECYQEQIDCGDSQQKGLSNLICTSEFDPLCGSDGRTYGNKCQFCNAFSRSRGTLFLRHRGQC